MPNQPLSILVVLVATCVGLAGCTNNSENDASGRSAAQDGPAKESVQPDFSPRLIKIAGEYLSYPLVDQHIEWAPAPCGPPSSPPAIEYSRSDDQESHGDKLYLLFAAKRDEYMDADKSASPHGQVVVKESWQAIAQNGVGNDFYVNHASGNQITNQATKNGQHFKLGKPKELFIMYKVDPSTPGTDEGWVYGVVAADKLSVIESGKLTNCMECHVDAGPDRLFGPINPRPGQQD